MNIDDLKYGWYKCYPKRKYSGKLPESFVGFWCKTPLSGSKQLVFMDKFNVKTFLTDCEVEQVMYAMDPLRVEFDTNREPLPYFKRIDEMVLDYKSLPYIRLYYDAENYQLWTRRIDPVETNWELEIPDLTEAEMEYIFHVYPEIKEKY